FPVPDCRKRPPLFPETSHDIRFGFQNHPGTGIASRQKAELGRRKACGVALQPDFAERIDKTRIDRDPYRYRTGAKLRLRLDIVEGLPVDGYIDHAVITGIAEKGRHELLPIGSRLGQQSERPGNRPVSILNKRRDVIERFLKFLFAAVYGESGGIMERIDD